MLRRRVSTRKTGQPSLKKKVKDNLPISPNPAIRGATEATQTESTRTCETDMTSSEITSLIVNGLKDGFNPTNTMDVFSDFGLDATGVLDISNDQFEMGASFSISTPELNSETPSTGHPLPEGPEQILEPTEAFTILNPSYDKDDLFVSKA